MELCYRCGEIFGRLHLAICKGFNRCCFNCKRIGHLAKTCRNAKQCSVYVNSIRVIQRKSEKKKERDQRRWMEFTSRKATLAELPFSVISEPEFRAMEFDSAVPTHVKTRHILVADKVNILNEKIQDLISKNEDLVNEIKTLNGKNFSLTERLRDIESQQNEEETLRKTISDLRNVQSCQQKQTNRKSAVVKSEKRREKFRRKIIRSVSRV
ncbi:hypothetical protein FSP39_023826 [Pinctada imbricata]|uniref:CCHC-type domain-containing protein n=1 Tax=Pinctada imbricata TaxID=66713 RepID=A0AA88YRH1_PINIB|nr:hypothetical protein FSP39_023826 [Pinctada imbricata]